MPYETLLFHILSVVALLAFVIGLVVRGRLWLRSGAGEASHPREGIARRIRVFGRVLWSDVLAYRGRARAEGRAAWAAHMMLVWGFIALAAISVVANASDVTGYARYEPDAPQYAVPGDLGGLLLLVGSVLVIVRRVRAKRHGRAPGGLGDATTAAFIIVAALSGYLVESSRFLSEPGGRADDWWSFMGAPLAALIRTPRIDWYTAWLIAWWAHAGVSLALIVYLPHGRLFRHFVEPLIEALAPTGIVRGSSSPGRLIAKGDRR
jgi:nitrate reductase gamma subunit